MDRDGLYKDVLLDHFRHPRNHGGLEHTGARRRARNPLCGDELEVGVEFDGDLLRRVAFRGRCCSVCMASASMMTEAVAGATRAEAQRLAGEVAAWFAPVPGPGVPDLPERLEALAPVRHHPGRRRCVLLPWEALGEILAADPA